MNEPTRLSSRILPTQNMESHPHYKWVVIGISLLLIIVIALFLIAYFIIGAKKSSSPAIDQEAIETQAFFKSNPPSKKPMTDEEKKDTADFFAKNKATTQ